MAQEETALLAKDFSINTSIQDDDNIDNQDNMQTSSDEAQKDLNLPSKKSKWWRFLIVYALTCIMVIARSCDTVLYVRLTYEIQNYM